MSENIHIIEPVIADLGEFEVRRLLPSAGCRSVGPFVFWDHAGPVTLSPDANVDVRPHPHIGLATLTWMFDGTITHRDSLGYTQDITPGEVNWMTAGKGIVHSERTPDRLRGQEKPVHLLQIWIGLPREHEETEPSFQHYPAGSIPAVMLGEQRFDLIAGSALGKTSPVSVHSPLCYLAARMDADSGFRWSRIHPEEAIYVVEGALEIDGTVVEAGHMAVFAGRDSIRVHSPGGARLALLGGEPIGHRYLWWNFVSSSRRKIHEAAALWASGGFSRVDGDEEFIPLPKDRPMP